MTTKLPHSSPRTFSESYKRAVLEPAVQKATAADGTIQATSPLAGAEVLAKDALVGAAGQDADVFLAQATQNAFDAAAVAAGPDGRLSKADAQQLPQDLRMAFHFMKSGELPSTTATGTGPSAPLTVPTATSDGTPVRFSTNVFRDVASQYNITDGQALVDTAAQIGDGNAYLNRTELKDAAQALRTNTPNLADFSWSDNVVDRVLQKFGLGDRQALLQAATRFDLDGNRYLKTSELEAAAKELTGANTELGIISDIDKTLLPPHSNRNNLPAPYPGITQLINELEGARPGDVHYVTARQQQSVDQSDIPAWMQRSGLPEGTIDTGISPLPWVARGEKVKDISVHMDANPNQRFVLFGDNSHADHQAYKEIIDKYPGRVVAAFIHNVKNVAIAQDPNLHLIDSYADAAETLLDVGAIDAQAARRVMVAAQTEGLNITDAQISARLGE